MFKQINDVNLHYQVYGEGVPMVIIHGYSLDMTSMKGCLEPVFDQVDGYKRIYIDLPGMGKTKAHDSIANADDMLALVVAFVDQVVGQEPLLVAGLSYGGYLARGLHKALGDQVIGNLLICPVVKPLHKDRRVPDQDPLVRDEAFLATLTEDQVEDFEDLAVVMTQRVWDRYQKEIVEPFGQADAAYLEQFQAKGYAFTEDVDDTKESYKCPCLFFAGKQDGVVGYEDLADLLPKYERGELHVLDLAGHTLQIDRQDAFEMLTKEWLDRFKREA